MIIALTAEETIQAEQSIIHTLFENGLDMLHVRKYHFTDLQMSKYVASIDATYHHKLVMHSHPLLSFELGINRIHLSESNRKDGYQQGRVRGSIYSTSVHHIDQFNNLDNRWDYAFLSPLFASISKPGYGVNNALLDQLQLRSNFDVRLIGLGGINAANCQLPLQYGADGIALFGALWRYPETIQNFISCKKSYGKTPIYLPRTNNNTTKE